MKKLLLILGICAGVNLSHAQDVTPGFQDSHHNLIGTIQNGTIYDQNHNFLGQFKSDPQHWSIIDSHHKTVGYIVNNNEIVDLGNNTIGYLIANKDYSTTIQDANHSVIGRIKNDGTVESTLHGVLGYSVKTEPMWAAAYFFFTKS